MDNIMIITETKVINGQEFIHTYSDANMMIEREGILYSDAYDLAEYGRTYTETNISITAEVEEEVKQMNQADLIMTLVKLKAGE